MRLIPWARSVMRNRHAAVPRPSWCTYLVTYRCNARCQMCDSWRIAPGHELTPLEVAAVFGEIGHLDVVRDHRRRAVPPPRSHPNRRGHSQHTAAPHIIHISTNGSFPDRIVDFVNSCSRPNRLRFMISFDGLPEEHDRNRGRAVPFSQAFESVRRLAELRTSHGIEVSANHTIITPQSLADAPGLRSKLAELGVEVHTVVAYSDSAMYGQERHGHSAEDLIVPTGYPLHPALADCDIVGFVERELRDVRKLRNPLLRWGKRYYLRGLLVRLRNETPARPNPRCVALRSHIRLLPDGRVPICQFNTNTVGDLRTQPFHDVWYNGTSSGARKWVDRCPGCWAECEVIPSAIYTADILRNW